MGGRGIKSHVKYRGITYYSAGVAHRKKDEARKEAERIRRKGGNARIRKYKFGYVVYGRVR